MKIKICCIESVAEARLAIEAGATAIGLVSEMPSGPGVISEKRIAEIVRAEGSRVDTFLLTSKHDPAAIIRQQERTGARTLQLVDRLPGGSHQALRAALPDVSIVQVVHVRDESSVREALHIAPACDALLLDSGRPGGDEPAGVEKTLGGTGQVHDWALSREIVERAEVPVYLAGGLTAENVREAVAAVSPQGVDLCGGVRTDGRLDPEKLAAFFEAVR
jgi:phosphoribosylanthranilate isomerase